MLVLSRQIGEGFWIDDRTFIKVLGIGRKSVKLGIDAPCEISIMRNELMTRGDLERFEVSEERRRDAEPAASDPG